ETSSAPVSIRVKSTAADAYTSVATLYNVPVVVGNDDNRLDSLLGRLTVWDSSSVTLLDQGSTTAHSYTFRSDTVERDGGPSAGGVTIDLRPVMWGRLSLAAGSASDTFTVADSAHYSSRRATLKGGGGSDTLVGPDTASTFNITGADAGTLDKFAFSSIENLQGGTADD